MELKQKYETICYIFDKQKDETFSQMIERVVFSPLRREYFDRFCQFVSLDHDELRSCWQFFHADRKDKKQDYISLSASKVLKIEQTDKEELSPVIRSFLPLLSQHIFTMNSLETQLLMELRDSLLPGLMSGRIKIQEP